MTQNKMKTHPTFLPLFDTLDYIKKQRPPNHLVPLQKKTF